MKTPNPTLVASTSLVFIQLLDYFSFLNCKLRIKSIIALNYLTNYLQSLKMCSKGSWHLAWWLWNLYPRPQYWVQVSALAPYSNFLVVKHTLHEFVSFPYHFTVGKL